MARALQASRQRLENSIARRSLLPRFNQAHAEKTMQSCRTSAQTLMGFTQRYARPKRMTRPLSPSSARPQGILAETVEIRIRDNGAGIPPDVRERCSIPFSPPSRPRGHGLGLSMTHDIVVEQHGGRIDVETVPGEFTEFIITLPRGNASSSNPE